MCEYVYVWMKISQNWWSVYTVCVLVTQENMFLAHDSNGKTSRFSLCAFLFEVGGKTLVKNLCCT